MACFSFFTLFNKKSIIHNNKVRLIRFEMILLNCICCAKPICFCSFDSVAYCNYCFYFFSFRSNLKLMTISAFLLFYWLGYSKCTDEVKGSLLFFFFALLCSILWADKLVLKIENCQKIASLRWNSSVYSMCKWNRR